MSALPLSGMVVVELGHSVAAPVAGQILADLGADVVKIEKPAGDDARKWGPPYLDGVAATFQSINRNKRSVVCELRDAGQRARLVDFIVQKADVVLQNLRPGQVKELGLDAQTLCAKKPSLVYCNVGAFGARGPLSKKPGYDPLMQAFGGVMSVVGEEGRPPVRVGPSIIDQGTAMWGTIGILAALLKRKDTGKGGVVDVSLFETSAAWMVMHAAHYLGSGEIPRRYGSGQVGIAPYKAYQTRDGFLVVAAGNDGLFRKLCEALKSSLFSDPLYKTNPDRVQNAASLYAILDAEMLEKSNAEWAELLEKAGVPCAPVQNVKQMLEHEQTAALGLLQPVPGSSQPLIGLPVSFDNQRPLPRSAAPALGAHTAEVLEKKQ